MWRTGAFFCTVDLRRILKIFGLRLNKDRKAPTHPHPDTLPGWCRVVALPRRLCTRIGFATGRKTLAAETFGMVGKKFDGNFDGPNPISDGYFIGLDL